MQLYWTKHFRKQYDRLSPVGQAAVCHALERFNHPGKTQQLQRFPGCHELRAGRRWRIIWWRGPDNLIVLRSVGIHDRVLNRP